MIGHLKNYILFLLLLIPMCSIQAQKNCSKPDNTILIISSYNPDTRTTAETLSEFMREYSLIGGKKNVAVESMNCRNLPESKQWRSRMTEILKKYSNGTSQPALVILLGVEASSAFLSLDNDFVHKQPIMFGMRNCNVILLPPHDVNIRDWNPEPLNLLKNFKNFNIAGGIIYRYDVEKNIKLIRHLYPQTRTVAFLSDNTFGGLAMQTYVKKEMKRFADINLQLIDGRKLSFIKVNDMVSKIPDSTAVLVGTWRIDCSDNYVLGSTTHMLCATNPRLHVFSMSSVGLDSWAIGGYSPDYHNIGKELADDCDAFLKSHHNLEVKILDGMYQFDYNRLKYFNIDPSRLPTDSHFINEPPSFYQQNEHLVIGISIFIIFLIICLCIAFYYIVHMNRMKRILLTQSKELKQAKEEAEEASRMKTSFLANMSHEIRTPLNAIVGFSNVITDTSMEITEEERRNFGDIIQQNSLLLLHLINDILDLSSIESGRLAMQLGNCEVIALCRSVISTTESLHRTSAVFQFEPPVETFYLRTDEQRLSQVLINLLTNASKFTKEGFIRLSIDIDETNNIVQFSVTDTGCGIPTDKMEAVFERFEKLNNFAQGTGLGLAISRMIVEKLGGRIWVDTTYKEGARFIFTHSMTLA
jgi:signal transduction histidine kinase